MRADSGLIALSIIIFIAVMLIGDLLFLPIIDYAVESQIQTFTAHLFTTSIVVLAVVGISRVFKRCF